MKRIILAAICLAGFAVSVWAADDDAYTNGQSLVTSGSAYTATPARLALDPESSLVASVLWRDDLNVWRVWVLAVDAATNRVKLVVGGALCDSVKVDVTPAQLNNAFADVSAATPHRQLLKALLRAARRQLERGEIIP